MQGQRRAAWVAVHGVASTTVAGSVRDDREGDAAASPSGSDAEASDADGVHLSPDSASPISTLVALLCRVRARELNHEFFHKMYPQIVLPEVSHNVNLLRYRSQAVPTTAPSCAQGADAPHMQGGLMCAAILFMKEVKVNKLIATVSRVIE